MTETLLETIRLPDDIKNLRIDELKLLASRLRDLIIEVVMRNGGHLASNLGVVELTLALYKVFDFPRDKIVWDVGHQAYVHKILSGRADRFATLRRQGGLSGFPKREESPYDAFNTGHSSTSISAALGIARACEQSGESCRVIAVTGDGALTGGLCYEAMNDAGRSANDLTVILNDNEMSISGNVGGISKYLNRIRSMPRYFSLREGIHSSLDKVPYVGKPFASVISRLKSILKYAIIPGVYFEEMGFKYIGPIDGHNVEELVKIFGGIAKMRGPVLAHVLTKKGKGYALAQSDPQKYHGVTPAETAEEPTAETHSNAKQLSSAKASSGNGQLPPAKVSSDTNALRSNGLMSFSEVFGSEMIRIAAEDSDVVAVSAAMASGVGLAEFSRIFPKRFYDVGIAEQHAVTLSAGMSLYGVRPVCALYSTFLQRAYDQILHDVCLQNAHVTIAIDRAGIVGEDGETHQGLYDMAFLRHMPNLTIMAPAYDGELSAMLRYALYGVKGPVALRYPKGIVGFDAIRQKCERMGIRASLIRNHGDTDESADCYESADCGEGLRAGRGELLLSGGDITVVSVGVMLGAALDAAAELKSLGYEADLISARFIKPFDERLIADSVKKTGRLLVAEDGCVVGGFGEAAAASLAGITYKAAFCGLPDKPIEQGARNEILHKYGLDARGLLDSAIKLLKG